jgi:nucleoside-diphosphate-sugar epimerase
MRVLVTGSEGFLAKRLIARLRGAEIRAFDAGLGHDLRDPAAVADACAGVDRVFHLAFVPGRSAERDWPGALETNVAGSANLLAACARLAKPPVFVFASAIAVYGPTPDGIVDDDTPTTGIGAYAAAKRAIEILIAEAARTGRVDGRSIRLPTTLVRPSRKGPTTAGFVSDLIVARAAGRDYAAPLPLDRVFAVAALRRSILALLTSAGAPGDAFGPSRAIGLPTIAVTPQDAIDALARVYGPRPGGVSVAYDAEIDAMIGGWPGHVRSARASALGLDPDETIDEIVRRYRDDPEGFQIP